MTPALTHESRAELRKLAEASLAERESGSSSRVRRLDFIHKVGEERSILALLDALEKTEHSWKTTAKGYKRLEAECERLKAWKAEASAVLKDHHDALQRHGKLGGMAAELAEAVGLLREMRAKIRTHMNGYCFGGPLLHQTDLLLAQHQRPPEEGGAK